MRPVQDVEVYLCREPVDFRKAINGLSIVVEASLGLDPFAARLYVFRNRKEDRVKVLYWERNGFVLWQKKLEKDRFPWPRDHGTEVIELSGRELNWLLDGMDVFAMKPHGELFYETVL